MRELALSYGVYVNFMEKWTSNDEFISNALRSLMNKSKIRDKDRIVVLAGNFGANHGPSFMEISEAGQLFEVCNLGNRKFDLHLEGLKTLWAKVELYGETIEDSADRLFGAD